MEEIVPSEAITSVRLREIHRELLTELKQDRCGKFWVLGRA